MKKWVARAILAVVILIIIGGVVAFFCLNSIVKGGVEKIGPRITQTDVKLESANISPFSGSGELRGLLVGNPSGYNTPSAIKVGDVKVAINIKSVLSTVVVVDSIAIEGPEVTFEGGIGGNNLSKLLDNISSVAKSDTTSTVPQEKPAEGGKKFKVKDLVIKGTKVNATLTGMGGKVVTLSLPEIHVTDIGSDQDGVSSAELARVVIREILASTMKNLSGVTGPLGKQMGNIGKEAGTQVEKATKGLKGLFKK